MSERIYQEQLAPIIDKLKAVCKANGIPLVVAVEIQGETKAAVVGHSIALNKAHPLMVSAALTLKDKEKATA